jgi:fructokinase
MHLVCLGELLVDFFPLELGKSHADVTGWRKAPGGAPANVAVAAARLGAESAFVGKVGDDPFGHWLVDVVARERVDTRGMAIDPDARTTLSIMAMPDANHYDCMFYRNPGADIMLRPEDLDGDLLRSTRAFHFGSLSLTHEPARSAALAAARIAREGGALVSFDVNYRPTLWSEPAEAVDHVRATIPLADLVKVNEGELSLLTGLRLDFAAPDWQEQALVAASRLLDLGPTLIIVTLGPNGALYRTRTAGGYVPGFTVETVDATGCGDAFIAGLLWQLVRATGPVPAPDGAPRPDTDALLPGILRYANAVGALTATRQGVIPSLPTAAEVEAFLLNQNPT